MKAKISSLKINITNSEILEKIKEPQNLDRDQLIDLVEKLLLKSKLFLDISFLYQFFPTKLSSIDNTFSNHHLKHNSDYILEFENAPCYFMFAICLAEKFDKYSIEYLKTEIEKEIWKIIGAITVRKSLGIMSWDIKHQILPMKIIEIDKDILFQPILSKKQTIIMLESYDLQFYDHNTLYGISELSLAGIAPVISN
ncbi:MAG: hypothetical protein WCK78_01730 [Paludibacter sp.]